jgi:hypothetical protein
MICDECDSDPETCECSREDCEELRDQEAMEYEFEGRREARE